MAEHEKKVYNQAIRPDKHGAYRIQSELSLSTDETDRSKTWTKFVLARNLGIKIRKTLGIEHTTEDLGKFEGMENKIDTWKLEVVVMRPEDYDKLVGNE